MKRTAVMVISRLDVGGAERLVLEDVRELLSRGWRVHLITLRGELEHSLLPTLPSQCQWREITFWTLRSIPAWIELVRFLRKSEPDLIMSHLWYANTITRVAGFFARTCDKTLVFEHNVYDNLKTTKQFYADRFLQGWCRKIIAVSSAVQASLIKHDIAQDHILVINNAIDTRVFSNAPRIAIRDELTLGDAFTYLFVGRLMPQKGVDILLRALASVHNGIVLIAGDGKEMADLRRLVDTLHLQKRVVFLGVRDDIPSLMRSTDCFVLPSRWEGFGIVLLEAMAAGLPIISTDFPAVHDILRDRETALIVPCEDERALAAAMIEMEQDGNLRGSLAVEAKRVCQRDFSLSSRIDRVIATV